MTNAPKEPECVDAYGATVGELLIMKRLDFIADILRFWVESHPPGGFDAQWIRRRQADYEGETFKLMQEAGIFDEYQY